MGRAKLGVALSGGGVRGFAHIGVLEVLDEAQVPVDYLAGTSMGGIIAGLYAAGVPLKELARRVCGLSLLDIATPDPARRGLFGQAKLAHLLAELLGSEQLTFADLRLPLAVVATDLEAGEPVLLHSGPLIPALLATAAFPIVFAPVYHQGRWLVDGGALNNVPVDIVRQLGADRVIAVTTPSVVRLLPATEEPRPALGPRSLLAALFHPTEWKLPLLIGEQTVGIAIDALNDLRFQRYPPDLVITVPTEMAGVFATDHSAEMVQAGREAARQALPALLQLRDTPLPPLWQRRWLGRAARLRRAWAVLRSADDRPLAWSGRITLS